jgi:hypothetical protein
MRGPRALTVLLRDNVYAGQKQDHRAIAKSSPFWILNFGPWNFLGIWCFEFGISPPGPQFFSAPFSPVLRSKCRCK